jgi:serine protease Do
MGDVLCLVLLFFVAQAAGAVELPDFTTLVARQGAAVVNISTTQQVREREPGVPGFGEGERMFDFFRRFVPPHPRLPEPESAPDDESLGSGFIISEDGYIPTNAHVVDGADEILVRLADKRELPARVVGVDSRSDVALLKIEASGLPRVVLGDPAALKVGEWVVAIGSPFGFDHSVTAGIVSAKGRSLPDENFVPFIQTDVAINPGNSGGPLFNLRGEVVGINSQIYSRTGGFMGLSFAIPIDVAMDVQAQLRDSGRVRRGRIGVAIQEVSRALAQGFGLARAEGALVSTVEPGGPAARAGVAQGDVILRFGTRVVASSSDLPRIVAASRPGEPVDMVVMRGGVEHHLVVTVGEWEEEAGPARVTGKWEEPANGVGLSLAEPTAAQRRERRLDHGLIVERAQGAAALAGIRRGDVILALVRGGRHSPLHKVADFEGAVAGLHGEGSLVVLVLRGGVESYLSLKAGE